MSQGASTFILNTRFIPTMILSVGESLLRGGLLTWSAHYRGHPRGLMADGVILTVVAVSGVRRLVWSVECDSWEQQSPVCECEWVPHSSGRSREHNIRAGAGASSDRSQALSCDPSEDWPPGLVTCVQSPQWGECRPPHVSHVMSGLQLLCLGQGVTSGLGVECGE